MAGIIATGGWLAGIIVTGGWLVGRRYCDEWPDSCQHPGMRGALPEFTSSQFGFRAFLHSAIWPEHVLVTRGRRAAGGHRGYSL